jgi:hypothetical protein
MEPKPPSGGDIRVQLAAIEAAVDAGNTDLAGLGFWAVVRSAKADPALAESHADAIGRIDRKAFERRVRLRIPLAVGNTVLLVGVALGGALLGWAVACDHPGQAAIGLIAAGAVLTVSSHDPAHWLVGRLGGIRFTSYFFSRPLLQPGLKTDYATYVRATPKARARMHAAGAVASKVAPFVSLALWPATSAPGWAALVVLAHGLIQITTDVIWSTKKSDWKRYSRERRLAEALRSS